MITSDKLHGFFPIFPWQNQQQKLDSLISAIGFRRLQPETPAEKKAAQLKDPSEFVAATSGQQDAGRNFRRQTRADKSLDAWDWKTVSHVSQYVSKFLHWKRKSAECSNLISLAWKKSLNLLSSFRELSSVIPLWNSIASCCFNAWKDAETWKHCTWIHRKLAVLCSEDREQHVLKKKYFRRWEVSPHFNSKHW